MCNVWVAFSFYLLTFIIFSLFLNYYFLLEFVMEVSLYCQICRSAEYNTMKSLWKEVWHQKKKRKEEKAYKIKSFPTKTFLRHSFLCILLSNFVLFSDLCEKVGALTSVFLDYDFTRNHTNLLKVTWQIPGREQINNNTVVLQESILRALFFNIHINDLFYVTEMANVCNYADERHFILVALKD